MGEVTNDWWVGADDEYMNIGGPFPTRDAAIEAGRADRCGDPFYITRAVLHQWSAPDAVSVIDHWIDSSDELWFEDGFPGFDGPNEKERTKAAEDDLQAVLNDWFARHADLLPTPTTFASAWGGEWIDKATPTPEAPNA